MINLDEVSTANLFLVGEGGGGGTVDFVIGIRDDATSAVAAAAAELSQHEAANLAIFLLALVCPDALSSAALAQLAADALEVSDDD